MREGNPSRDPDYIEKSVEADVKKIVENVDRRIEQSNASAERYVAAVSVLERVSAHDSALTTQLEGSLRAEAAGAVYEEPRAVIDAAQYIIDHFGNPYSQKKLADIHTVAARAFEELVQQQYDYFEGR
ncbi:MAG: hypothetical protein HZC01_04600 [Candidatus Kerfeldbacteria bacterium]|nr:hypothetical protein [Candidatus Kerfeldbacteria bacterium]